MIIELSHYFLALSLLVVLAWKNQKVSLTFFIFTYVFFGLFLSYVCSDFSIANVFSNSNINAPIFYKISGTWSNHEGSLLLWCWILSAYGFALCYLARFSLNLKMYILIVLFFFLFCVATSNPFLRISFICTNSLTELNPVLQDPILAIHPPCIYAGYVASAIAFSLYLSSFFLLRIWILLCWFFLTVGILLGSWWAYHELGWGGWWFWDPVENASLMPWLVATAAIHSLLLPRYNPWTFVFVAFTFLLSILGTFFVRSGLLSSVHSFATDSTRGIFLFTFFCLLCIICLILFLKKGQKRKNSAVMGLQGFFFCLICLVVLWGTVAPVFFHWLFARDFSIGAPFYNGTIVPLFTSVFLLLIYTSLNTSKPLHRVKVFALYFQFFFHSYLLVTFFQFSVLGSIYSSLCFLLFVCLFVSKGSLQMKISHAGVVFLILGIILSQSKQINFTSLLHIGSEFSLGTERCCLRSIDQNYGPTFQAICGNLVIYKDPSLGVNMFPEKRFFLLNNTSKIAIHTNLFTDFYALIGSGSYETGWYTTILKLPFLFLIWIGFFFASVGSMLSLRLQLSKKKVDWL